jgi:hypothetical protein
MTKIDDITRLYRIFDTLEAALGGKHFLSKLAPSSSFPGRGVYFFFEPGELRTGSGSGYRLVRVARTPWALAHARHCTSAYVSMPENRRVSAEITGDQFLDFSSAML